MRDQIGLDTYMDTSRLGRGETIAAASAVALFLIMFIFDWFGFDVPAGAFSDLGGANAFQSFGFIDLVLMLTVIVAIAGAALAANASSVNTPVAISSITAGLGILSVILILFRIISPPDFGVGDFGLGDIEVSRKIGVFLGLIAAGGIAYGGWVAMQEEGTSFGDQADRFGGTGSPPPPAA